MEKSPENVSYNIPETELADEFTDDENNDEIELTPNELIASRLLTSQHNEAPESLADIYENNKQDITQLEYTVEGEAVRTLYVAELLIGHKDAAVDFYDRMIDQIHELPDDMKPDIAIASGFMQGSFENILKSRRATLVPDLKTMDKQFKHGRDKLQKLQDTGANVVYNMGDDDMRIAEEMTYQTFQKMEDYAKSNKEFSLSRSERMKRNPHWNEHHNFNITEVFPYNLRNGRDLYSEEEMSDLTNGQIDCDEYFVLFETRKAIENDEPVPPEYSQWIEAQEAKQMKDLAIADDFNMTVKTDGAEYDTWVRHYLSLTGVSKPANHMRPGSDMLATLAANGHETPHRLVTQNNLEEVGTNSGGKWSISAGGLQRPRNFVNSPLRSTAAYGDNSRRLVTTRRRIPEPSASIHEDTDDGRTIVTFFNDKLMEKSHSIPDRITIAETCDWQSGSITARPDLLAKHLDIIRQQMGERSVAMFFGGDHVHGFNYANFPFESQQTGLIAVGSQKEFNLQMLRASMGDMTKTEMDALDRILVQPGNHEWNTGTLKTHGDPFVDYIRSFYDRMYARAGYSDEEIDERVKSHEAIITKKGEYATDFTGVEYFGEMGVLIRHFLNDRGARGRGGGSPIYQANDMGNSGSLWQSVDILMAGHWHHPQYGLFADKLGVVGGSMAGLSGYELAKNYRATIGGTMIHIGGGLPPQLEFISEKALHDHEITHGELSEKSLKANGYRDDKGFDKYKHGIMLPDSFPKSALQKRIKEMMRSASQRANSIAELR